MVYASGERVEVGDWAGLNCGPDWAMVHVVSMYAHLTGGHVDVVCGRERLTLTRGDVAARMRLFLRGVTP